MMSLERQAHNGRVGYLDVTKFVVMYLVIWSHAVQYSLENSIANNIIHPYSFVITPFFMSLFMMLSGIFASSVLKRPFLEFVWDKLKQLVIPAFLWTSVAVVVLFVRGKNWFDLYGIWYFIWDYWFVKCLFLCYLLFWCSVKLFKDERLACVASIILVLIFPQGERVFLNSMLPFFWMGYFLRGWFLTGRCQWYYPIVLAVLYGVLLLGWSFDYTMYINNQNFVSLLDGTFISYNAFVMFYRFVMGVVGSLFIATLVMVLYPKISDLRVTRWMERCGQETYGIYMIHVMALVFMSWFYVLPEETNIYLFNFLYVHGFNIVTLFISIFVIEVLSRLRLTRVLLLGKKG